MDELDALDREIRRDRHRVKGSLMHGRAGLPEGQPYVWNALGEARAAEVEAQLEAIRATISKANECLICSD